MSFALHAHQTLLIATLAFSAAVLIPDWYTSPDQQIKRNIFQICTSNPHPYTCHWILLPTAENVTIRTVFPIITASIAIACSGISLLALLLGSYYIQRDSGSIGSKWLIVLIEICVFFSFLLSCGVWAIMLTTNLHENNVAVRDVRLLDFGFSIWINIGASGGYFYAFFIYLIVICKSS